MDYTISIDILNKSPDVQKFSWNETLGLLTQASQIRNLVLPPEKKCFLEKDSEGKDVYVFIPPIVFPILDVKSVEEYIQSLPLELGTHLVLLIHVGAASLGVYKNGELCMHKVITKYMTRKKQGKAQITYLKTKGTSRAGSRIRLRESVEFFEEINGKLAEWKDMIGECKKVWYSCPVRIWTELFASDIKPPFTWDDPRLAKIPLSVRKPGFKELKHIFFTLSHGLFWERNDKSIEGFKN